jgi:hypothetical protein
MNACKREAERIHGYDKSERDTRGLYPFIMDTQKVAEYVSARYGKLNACEEEDPRVETIRRSCILL